MLSQMFLMELCVQGVKVWLNSNINREIVHVITQLYFCGVVVRIIFI